MIAWFKRMRCNMTHGGGRILRDSLGRINWQCAKCGRWSVPVPLDEEARLVKEMKWAKVAIRNKD